MPAILTTNFSTINTENFLQSFEDKTDNTNSKLYLTIGKGFPGRDQTENKIWTKYTDDSYHKPLESSATDYPDVTCNFNQDTAPINPDTNPDDFNRWDDLTTTETVESEDQPFTPHDTEKEKTEFRRNIIAIKKLIRSELNIMVPRINWKEGSIYKPIDRTAPQGKRAQNYYVLSQGDASLEVWECIESGTGTTTKDSNPLLEKVSDKTEGTQATYKSPDGYKWKFLYNLSSAYVTNGTLLDNWMPVPYAKFGGKTYGTRPAYDSDSDGTLTVNQKNYGDVNANRTLGAHRILVSTRLENEFTVGEIDCLPYDSIYRQVGLLVDPLGKTDEGVSTNTRLTGDYYNTENVLADGSEVSAGQKFDIESGELIYMDYRKPVMRDEGQSETVQLILVF